MTNYKSDQLKIGNIYGWHVYLVIEGGRSKFCKIGTAARIDIRLASLQGGNPRKLSVIKSWHCDDRDTARSVESAALDLAGERRVVKSEWIKCAPDYAAQVIEQAIKRVGATLRSDTAPQWDRS